MDGKILKEVTLPTIIDEVDIIINLPKLKTHSLMVYTLGVKNLFGFIPGGRKPDYHAKAQDVEHFAELLCDIYQILKPKITLTIADGIIGMEGNGPSSGTPKKAGVIIISEDAGAIDYIAGKMISLETPLMNCILQRKLLDINEIETIGQIPNIPFKAPTGSSLIRKLPTFLQKMVGNNMVAHPYVKKKKCIKCRVCMKSCPVKAITLNPYPEFNRKKCVDCYCCHELCPENAIYLKGTIIRSMISLVMHIRSAIRRDKSQ